jgi:redox-sensitive bicupin YhaK (pirin superfamily)
MTQLEASRIQNATMATRRGIAQAVEMPHHSFDQHSGAAMFRVDPQLISPFLGIDSYTMPQPFFGPHPHAGMSAVSLMLPEADAGFINRDSLGDHSLIAPGDLHWTQAGRGMMHEEVPAEPGKAARGMQVFVNLRREHKQAEPAALAVRAKDVPIYSFEGGQVRVVTGELHTDQGVLTSPIAKDPRWLTRANMWDVSLDAGASVELAVPHGHNAFFVVRSGEFKGFGPVPSANRASVAIIFEVSGDAVTLQAGALALRGVLFSGEPINEPVFSDGPFTGNTAEDIVAYKRAFASGAMGQLAATYPRG